VATRPTDSTAVPATTRSTAATGSAMSSTTQVAQPSSPSWPRSTTYVTTANQPTTTDPPRRDNIKTDVERLRGGAGADDLRGSDPDTIGGTGANMIWGGDGDDALHGAGGNDQLFGDRGNDDVSGDAGSDTLHGGDDTCTAAATMTS
jgi:Ca2+-binding RTX toxin-like protein